MSKWVDDVQVMTASVITVAIVEDDAALRQQVVEQLEMTPGFECVGHFSNGEAGIEGILSLTPDVALMDINLPDCSGVQCVQQILSSAPATRIVMYTAFENSKQVFEALEAGASGYIVKRKSFNEVLDAIVDVKDGGAPMTPHIARKVVQSFRRQTTDELTERERLTQRETEILDLVARGYQNKEVARDLGISAETVRVHLRNIYVKWQVSNRAAATAAYLETKR